MTCCPGKGRDCQSCPDYINEPDVNAVGCLCPSRPLREAKRRVVERHDALLKAIDALLATAIVSGPEYGEAVATVDVAALAALAALKEARG